MYVCKQDKQTTTEYTHHTVQKEIRRNLNKL